MKSSENEFMYIYEWIDSLPLSRPKKNISRDFSDGGLLAEVIKHYYPKLVDVHNYPPASSSNQKCYNWSTLNNKVLRKIGVSLKQQEITDVITCKSMAIEHILQKVHAAIEKNKGKIATNSTAKQKVSTDELRKTLENKRNTLSQLKQIVDDLEMKVQSSLQYKQSLQNRINELNMQFAQ